MQIEADVFSALAGTRLRKRDASLGRSPNTYLG